MKWSVQQLNKYVGKEFSFSANYDLSSKIKSLYDVIEVGETKVSGTCSVAQMNVFKFTLHIEVMMIMECARTLEPVEFPLDVTSEEVFSYDTTNEDHIIIDTNTIDLFDIVWEIILVNKPIRVLKECNND